MNIVPIDFNSAPAAIAPTALSRRYMDINSDVASHAAYATISIKGKVFAITKDGTRQQLTKTDEDGEVVPVSFISISVLRANLKSRVYYREAFTEENSEGAKPTCYSHDGIAPSAGSAEPQCAKCQLCPHAVWGSKTGDAETGKGTACAPNARLAVAAPDKPSEPMLLRVPPASIKAFREAVKLGESRQLPYNQLVMRVGFDREAASPKLTFKPVGMLQDDDYEKVAAMYDDETVQQIVGTMDANAARAAIPVNEADELDAAIANQKAKPAIAAPAAPAGVPMEALAAVTGSDAEQVAEAEQALKAQKAAKAKAAKAKAEATEVQASAAPAAERAAPAVSDNDDLLGGLDSLLDGLDD